MKDQGSRKDSHLDVCLNEEVDYRSRRRTGLDDFRFEHLALPELALSDVDTRTKLFGKTLSAPLIIGAMTGGTPRTDKINARLIAAAAERGIGFASGSQRAAIQNKKILAGFIAATSNKKPAIYFGNLGAVQFNYGVNIEDVLELIEKTGCDALNIHMNALQECIQPEGQTNFRKLEEKIKKLAAKSPVPIVLKEVGSGISATQAKKISRLGVSAIETAGVGGTSWSKVESHRNIEGLKKKLGLSFSGWGIPTAESVLNCRKASKTMTVIASGGLRDGIDLAKTIALGANAGAMAIPFLKAAQVSTQAVIEEIDLVVSELRTAMFLSGVKNISELHKMKLKKSFDYSGRRP